MAGEIREVPMPDSTAAPEHTFSPEGAARLAALAPEQLAEGIVEDLRPPAEQGQDKPAEPAEQPPAPITSIAPLEGISAKYEAIAEDYRADLAAIADENSSLPPGELSTLFHFIGSRAAADMAKQETDANLTTGQVPGPNLANPEECRSRLRLKYGDMAKPIMDTAAAEFARLPEKVKAWLDADMGADRKLSNHPDVILGLALRPFARLSVEAAQKELATIRRSAAYQTGEALAIAKANMLQLVTNRTPQESKKSSGQFLTRTTKPAPSARESIQKNIDGLRRSPAYFDKGHAAHAETVRQVHALYAQLYPESSR